MIGAPRAHPPVNQSALLFLGLTAIVGALAGVLAFSVIKFITAARSLAKGRAADGNPSAFVATAMEDAIRSLRVQERAMKARAEASERLSEQIVASLTSGLLVVDQTGTIQMLNPAARRLLGLADDDWSRPYPEVLSGTPELGDLIKECLAQG